MLQLQLGGGLSKRTSGRRLNCGLSSCGTAVKRRLEVKDALQPSWSPDGKWIAYWGGRSGDPAARPLDHPAGRRERRSASPTTPPLTEAPPGRQARTTCTSPAIAAEPRTCGGSAFHGTRRRARGYRAGDGADERCCSSHAFRRTAGGSRTPPIRGRRLCSSLGFDPVNSRFRGASAPLSPEACICGRARAFQRTDRRSHSSDGDTSMTCSSCAPTAPGCGG